MTSVVYFTLLQWGGMFQCREKVSNVDVIFILCYVYRKIYRTIILPVVLYGCETWSLTLKDERRLRVFENRVLRRVFGPKR